MNVSFSGLRILYVAPVDNVDLAHNGLRRRALERLGVALLHVDPAKVGWLERLVRRDLDIRIGMAIDQHRPDLVIVAGEGVVPAESVGPLRRGLTPRWVQLLNDEVANPASASREAMAYDHVFVGSTGVLAGLERDGVKHAHYLAVGCDPSVHRPMSARGPFRSNVVFAGSATPRRERFLVELVEFGLALWGPGWRRTTLRDYCRGELPSTEDFVRAYAGATVGVNVHRTGSDDVRRRPTGVNRRTFEIASIGVPQVVDGRHDLAAQFEDSVELLVYTTAEELKGQVKRAIHDAKYRERLATGGRQRALREHTYMHRMYAMLQVVTGGGGIS